jgi:UDP-N-acetylglucosamine acyltransferase
MAPAPAIHRTAIVAPDVVVGAGTIIGPYAVILGPCTIGERCWIGPSAVIGGTGEHVEHMVVQTVPDGPPPTDDDIWFGSHGEGVVIGDRTIVRELSTIQSGTLAPTRVGSDVFMMNKSHVAHDVVLGDRVRMAPYATLGGHVVVQDDANVGMASAVHQWRVVGQGAMVGMSATVVKDVRPYELVKGSPARGGAVNRVQLENHGVSADESAALAAHYAGGSDTIPERFEAILATWESLRR